MVNGVSLSDENEVRSEETAGLSEEQAREVRRLRARAGGMLPGIAGIAMFMIFMTMLNAFAAARGSFGTGGAKYSILAICTLLVVGVFGLLPSPRTVVAKVRARLVPDTPTSSAMRA